jgi:CRP-like cAMP-binding protein
VIVREIRDLLAVHPLFAGLEDEYLDLVAGCGRNVRIRAGEWLFREGDPADTFFVVREGRATIEIHLARGGSFLLDSIGAGEVLDWSWLFPPFRWQFDSRASDDVRAVAIDGACLRTKCGDDHDLGYALMQRFAQLLVERLQSTRLRLLDVYGDGRAD